MNTEQLIQQEAERRNKTNKDQRNVEFRVFELHRDRRDVFIEGATFGASLNGWVHINGTETLPKEDGGEYFVYLTTGCGSSCYYDYENRFHQIGLNGQPVSINHLVTHYMKIVKP